MKAKTVITPQIYNAYNFNSYTYKIIRYKRYKKRKATNGQLGLKSIQK